MKPVSKTARRLQVFVLTALCAALGLILLNAVLQDGLAHRAPPYRPDYPAADLTAVLAKPVLTDEDFALLFAQTGLGPGAIADYLATGEDGMARILATQEGYFNPPPDACLALIPTTMEDRYVAGDGETPQAAVPLAPLRSGDIFVSFSTHTAGWRHGHAGLVVDGAQGITVESVSLGNLSAFLSAEHWASYTTFLLLRPREVDAEAVQTAVEFAIEHLEGIPYRLTSGLFGPKAIDPEGDLFAQCAYLPWYAYMQAGLDLDADGGAVVTVADLAHSPLLEVVQVYGIDPATLPNREPSGMK